MQKLEMENKNYLLHKNLIIETSKLEPRIWNYEVILIVTFEPRNLKIEVEVQNRTLSTWLRVSGLYVARAEF